MKNKICCHCGAKMVEYTFTFNKGLARCLYLLAQASHDYVEISKIKMTTSQWTNFQKLKYWGLIEAPESKKGGIWRITNSGLNFITGKTQIHSKVIMYRNKLSRYDGELIYFNDITDGYLYRCDYREQAYQQIMDIK